MTNDATAQFGEMEDATVSLDGMEVRYLHGGPENEPIDAPPVVLFHGGGLDSTALSWKYVLPALAAERTVYAPDWPGYGESDSPDGPPSVEYYVSILGRFLDALELDRVLLVGISMGGAAALGFALQHPEQVERLVAVDSYGLGKRIPGGPLGAAFVGVPSLTEATFAAMGHSRWAAKQAVAAVVPRENLTPELVDDALAELRRPRAGNAWAAFQREEVGFDGLQTDFTDRLSDLRVPTLFVHGEEDPLIPVDWSVRARTLAPEASIKVLADCGHWPPREKPDEFVAAVREFLAEF